MANSKIVKPDGDAHRLALVTEDGCEVFLVRGGPLRAYLWVGDKQGNLCTTISGEKALEALADAIKAELKDTGRRRRKPLTTPDRGRA